MRNNSSSEIRRPRFAGRFEEQIRLVFLFYFILFYFILNRSDSPHQGLS